MPTLANGSQHFLVAARVLGREDGGGSTTRQAYEEHLRYVHPYLTGEHYPEEEIQRQATESVKRWRELDIHFHAWTRDGFEMLLSAVAELAPFDIKAAQAAVNENIFVLRMQLESRSPTQITQFPI